jgi:hypothetical protein
MSYQGNYPPSTPLTSDQIAAGAVQPSNLSSVGPTWDGSGNLTITGGMTAGTAVMNIGSGQIYKDTSGNLGVGTTSPISKLDVRGTSISLNVVAGNGGVQLVSSNNATNSGYVAFFNNTPTRIGYIGYASSAGGGELTLATDNNNAINFTTNGSEKARVTSGGNFGIGTTNPGSKLTSYQTAVNNNIESSSPSTGMTHLLVSAGISTAGGSDALGVYDNGGISARITTNGYFQSRPNSYGSTSDERLKENIVDATPKLADIMQVRVRNFNYKDQPGEKQLGVIAQELETVFPGLVHEIPNANPEITDAETVKSVKYSVFVPMLIKAVQELSAKNDALEARLAALEAK